MRTEIEQWAREHIVWAGNEHTNKSDRRGFIPDVIVDHITEISIDQCKALFTSPDNDQNSTHFAVDRGGRVYQFVAIEDNAWGNGLPIENIPHATSQLVRERGVNPNWYSISIEHEGVYAESHGKLTREQLEATTMLHAYIIDYVRDKWNVDIPVSRKHIIGHGEIDPVRKWFCPGELYPFDTIIASLKKVDN